MDKAFPQELSPCALYTHNSSRSHHDLRGAVPPIFSDGETEAERGALTCLRSHSLAAEPGAAETGRRVRLPQPLTV